MHRRPSGVTLSAVVLGIFSLLLLFGGLFDVVVAVLFASNPAAFPPTAPGQPAPPQGLMQITFGFMALLTLICAAWGISTFVGLLRMRRWARISIMIIGGCLTALSLLELFGCIVVQLSMKSFVLPPNAGSTNLVAPNPEVIRGAFFFLDAFCLGIAAIGIGWLVYFARRKTGQAFELVPLQTSLSSTAQLNPAAPITDFSVAQPLAATAADVQAPTLQSTAPPAGRERPISMTIVAVLMCLGALSMLTCCLLPFPMFFFGVQLSGWSSHILLLSLGALYAVAAYGLLKRIHFGWLLAVGVHILGLLNVLTLLSPQVRDRWVGYTQTMMSSLMPAASGSSMASVQQLQQKMMSEMLVPSLVLSVVYVLFILVLLWRARWAYRNRE